MRMRGGEVDPAELMASVQPGREGGDVSSEALAEALGWPEQVIWRMRRGVREIRPGEAAEIRAAIERVREEERRAQLSYADERSSAVEGSVRCEECGSGEESGEAVFLVRLVAGEWGPGKTGRAEKTLILCRGCLGGTEASALGGAPAGMIT